MRQWFKLVITLWLWLCIETVHKSVLGIYISEKRNMFVAENFIHSLVHKYGKHTVYTDGGTWYDEACNIIGLKPYLHSSIEKGLMERVNKYLKDRIESFNSGLLKIEERKFYCLEINKEKLPEFFKSIGSILDEKWIISRALTLKKYILHILLVN